MGSNFSHDRVMLTNSPTEILTRKASKTQPPPQKQQQVLFFHDHGSISSFMNANAIKAIRIMFENSVKITGAFRRMQDVKEFSDIKSSVNWVLLVSAFILMLIRYMTEKITNASALI